MVAKKFAERTCGIVEVGAGLDGMWLLGYAAGIILEVIARMVLDRLPIEAEVNVMNML